MPLPNKDQTLKFVLPSGVIGAVLSILLMFAPPVKEVLGLVGDRVEQDTSVNLKLDNIDQDLADVKADVAEVRADQKNASHVYVLKTTYDAHRDAERRLADKRAIEVDRRLGELDRKADESLKLLMQIVAAQKGGG